MALSSKTFDYAGSAVEDIFSADSFKTKAKGYALEAENYDLAAAMATKNADLTRMSTALTVMGLQRQTFGIVGGQTADIASSGFANSGSALDILRDSARQGVLQEAVANYQGLVTEEGYRTQAASYRNMSQASRMAEQAAKKAGKNSYLKAGIKGAAAVASLFA